MNSDRPLVSVIIPTYNRPHLLGRALKSALNQTYRDFEVIVVDDASAQSPEPVIRDLKEERIRYIRHEKNKGLPGSRNTAIKAARGDYIALLDDDDEWLPEKLQKQVDRLQSAKESVGVVSCGHRVISDATGRTVRTRIPRYKGNVHERVLRGLFVGSGSVILIRKDCFKRAGLYDESLATAEDWEMVLRLSKYFEYDFIPEVLVITHFHGERISSAPEGKIRAREIILEKHRLEFSRYPAVLSEHLNRLGFLYGLTGNFNKARNYFVQSMKKKPWQRFAYWYFLISFMPTPLRRRALERDVARIDGVPIYW
jgi:glycosyltransferase involved in cell wall biosynthesis